MEIQNEVLIRLDKLVEAAGATISKGTDYCYPILVKQQVLIGTLVTIFTSIFLIGLLIAFTKGLSLAKKDDDWIPFPIFSSVFFFIALALFIFHGLPHLINPEYYALKEILSLLQSGGK